MLNEYTTQKISKLIKKGINSVISLSINELEDLSSGNVRFLYSYKNEFIYINIETRVIIIAEDYEYVFEAEDNVLQLFMYTDRCKIYTYKS